MKARFIYDGNQKNTVLKVNSIESIMATNDNPNKIFFRLTLSGNVSWAYPDVRTRDEMYEKLLIALDVINAADCIKL